MGSQLSILQPRGAQTEDTGASLGEAGTQALTSWGLGLHGEPSFLIGAFILCVQGAVTYVFWDL